MKAEPGVVTSALPEWSARWALFLDLDGTLLEIADTPDAVHVEARLREQLVALRVACGNALAVVSGRALSAIDALLAPLVLPAAGLHGLERRAADGSLHRAAVDVDGLRAASDRLRAFAARHPGVLLEDKGATLALHTRLAPAMAQAARAEIEAVRESLGEAFRIQAGKAVLELKPQGADKGSAIAAFLAEPPFAGRVPVFAGDDLTDEHGFAQVQARGGHAIRIGPGETIARWRLADVAALRAQFDRWLRSAHAR